LYIVLEPMVFGNQMDTGTVEEEYCIKKKRVRG
jgi:hypothetical protein